ncbi:MAG: radical SAM protein [Pirellulales bacterium]
MPHVAFVPFTGFRVREPEMLALGMTLPGLQPRAEAIGKLPALGVLALAGMTPPPWTCSYHDGETTDDLAQRVLRQRPKLVAISALTASVEEAYRFSRLMRREGVPTVIGGLHATVCPEEARRHCDAVVAGEGEPVWPNVLADALSGGLQPLYRAAQPFDLRLSPLPRFDLLGPAPRPRFTVQTQRGCPLACEFCGASRLLGPHRCKPPEVLERELNAIRNLSPRPLLELADDNTFVARHDTPALIETLSRCGGRYFTEADWRLGEQPGMLAALASSGCVQVLVGIESLVFRHPGMGAKQAKLSRIIDAISAIQAAGIAVIGCFIVGADGETKSSIDRLADFILASPLADVQLTVQTPFPGTPLYRRLQRQGRLLSQRGWPSYTLFDVTYQPDRLSVEELENAFRELVVRVFSASPAARRTQLRHQIWQRNPSLNRSASAPSPVT